MSIVNSKRFGLKALALGVALVSGSQVAMAARSTSYGYNELGLVSSVDGPRTDVSDITQYNYNLTSGNLESVVNALGHTYSMSEFDTQGRPTVITDANGLVTRLTYNFKHQITSQTIESELGHLVTVYTYDPVGQLTQIDTPNGSSIIYEYDDAHRMVGMSNNLGERIGYELDAAGNVLSTQTFDGSNALVRQHQQAYDELSRLRETVGGTDNQTTSIERDAAGNATTITDPKSNPSVQDYDIHNRLTNITDAAAGETAFTYNTNDQITTVTDPRGLVTSYEYNGHGDLTAIVSPDTGRTEFIHDDAGNVTQKTDARGVVTVYAYDALNRLTSITYPADASENVTFGYDDTTDGNKGIGRVTSISTAVSTLSYRYNNLGQVTELNTELSGEVSNQHYGLKFGYNALSQLEQLQYPSGRLVNYLYDGQGRLSSVTTQDDDSAEAKTLVDNLAYLPFGPVKGFEFGNGITQTFQYDLDYRLTNITSSVQDWVYHYDLNSNIEEIIDLNTADNTQIFEYDALNRLTKATGNYGEYSYDYDGVGNRTERVRTWNQGADVRTESYTYSPTANQLDQVDTDLNGVNTDMRTFQYDVSGQLLEDKNNARELDLAYNQAGRLDNVTFDQAALPEAEYRYNALGQRVVKVLKDTSGVVLTERHYHYNLNGQLLAETDGEGNVIREYLYLGNQALGLVVIGEGQTSVSSNVEPWEIDNTDPITIANGSWNSSGSAQGYYGSNYYYAPPSDPVEGDVVVDASDALTTGIWDTANTASDYRGPHYLVSATNQLVTTMQYDQDQATPIGTWWGSSRVPGYIGDDYKYAPASDGSGHMTWPLNMVGQYEVFVNYTSDTDRNTAAQYTVNHEGGQTQIVIDQTQGGAAWVSLGTFQLSDDSTLVLSDQSNDGFTIADAVKMEARDGGNYATSTWTLRAARDGEYELQAYWPSDAGNNTQARYQVIYTTTEGEQSPTFTLDQTQFDREWATLTTLNLTADQTVKVILSSQGNGPTVADTMQLMPTAEITNTFVWPINVPESGLYNVYAHWPARVDRASNAQYQIAADTELTNVIVDQRKDGSQWNRIATVQFNVGELNEVRLAGLGFGYATADAIRIEPVPVSTVVTSGPQLYYIHNDHLGTPRILTDQNMAKVWEIHSTPFGEVHQEIASGIEQIKAFPGQYRDGETGYSQNYFRDYDPSLGRYIQSDPIGLNGGLNTYGYVVGNPMKYSDPQGLVFIDQVGGGGPVIPPRVMQQIVDSAGAAYAIWYASHFGDDADWDDWDHPDEEDYPVWEPDSDRHSHPDKIDEAMALECETDSNCYEIAISIDILVRQLKFRRYDFQRKGGDPQHIPFYEGVRAKLRELMNAADQQGCPYNPEAVYEVNKTIFTPTPDYRL